MAIYVKPVPTLTGKSASDFIKKAETTAMHSGTVDFSKQMESAARILEKSKHNKL